MGGNSAWKKRVANGELAKGSGGAIARHRPRWGRKGKDLILNRKGHIAGGNPKKKKTKKRNDGDNNADIISPTSNNSEIHLSKRKSILQISYERWNHNVIIVVISIIFGFSFYYLLSLAMK